MIFLMEFFVPNGTALKSGHKLIVGHEALPGSVLSFADMDMKTAAPYTNSGPISTCPWRTWIVAATAKITSREYPPMRPSLGTKKTIAATISGPASAGASH
jgi:hypothetical protein